MEVHQFHSVMRSDGISDEALHITRILRGWGYRSYVFSESWDEAGAPYTLNYESYEKFSSPANVVIIHYWSWTPPISYALTLPDRKILVYHNVTPADFLEPYDHRQAEWSRHCRRMLSAFVGRVDLGLGVSQFNRRELEEVGIKPTGVLPLLIDWKRFEGPREERVLERYSSGPARILFVGRIAPNKYQHELVRVLERYTRALGKDAVLLLVGDDEGFPSYSRLVRGLSEALVPGKVVMTGKVSMEELKAYYETASVFVCLSGHEGFCTPLIEAMHSGVPVVAYAAGAVEETMGGAGVLMRTKDPLHVAKVVDALISNRAFRGHVLATQRERVKRFRSASLEPRLLAALATVFAVDGRKGGPRPALAEAPGLGV